MDWSRYGSLPRPDIKTYRPNPFWTAEENKRFKKLGNLERFGKWRPPGPYVNKINWTSKANEGFQYVNRPLPKDPWLRLEEYRWKGPKIEYMHQAPNVYFPGFLRGAAIALTAYLLLQGWKKYTNFKHGPYKSKYTAAEESASA